MWLLPRVSALGALLIVVGAFLIFALDLDVIAWVISGAIALVILLAIAFDLYEGPKK